MSRRIIRFGLAPLAVVLAGCGGSAAARAPGAGGQARPLSVVAEGTTLLRVSVPGDDVPVEQTAQRIVSRLPAVLRARHGRVRIVARIPAATATTALERTLRAGTARAVVPVVPLSSSIAVPPVHQVLHDDCEATALSMVLAAAGVQVGQLRLQAQLPQAQPVDPRDGVWGDPELGFVGRADGSGPAGGFGVYEPPIRALAARHGVRLVDLHGTSLATVRAVLLSGRAVLAWVGLADGPYETWRTPAGRSVTANMNEHAVALVGAGAGYVLVDDPLTGQRVRWSNREFSVRWQRLGRRALALPR